MNFALEADTFKKIVDAVKEIVTETNITVNENGLEIQAMDHSHVALVQVKIEKDKFLAFKCVKNRELGINLLNLSKILKSCGAEDKVTFIQEEKIEDKMKMCFENLAQTRSAEFMINLNQIECEKFELPDMEHDLKFIMPSKEFNKLCNDLREIGDTMTVTSDSKKISFHVKGDTTEGSIDFTNELGMVMPASSSYALKYMCMFSKAFPLCENVELLFSKEIPAAIKFDTNIGALSFFLAPKIDE